MRKVLSIVLALAMVLGCFASVFAAEFTDVKTTDDFATAVSVLTDLGVVSGYTDGTYKPEKVVTRAEMASLIVKALGLTPSASSTTNFSDVPASHWASGYIAYANSLGIIAGYTDGTFKPSKTVSYDEAVTMLVQALGYTAESLEGTTWPTAFIMKAQQLKITKGVELLGSVGANRGDIAELVYNTLPAAIGKTNKDGDFVPNADADTMYKRLGAITTDAAGKALVKVVTDKTEAAIDLDEYLGAEVTYVMNEDGEILAITAVNTEYLEGKATATKIGSTKLASTASYTGVTVFKNGAATTEEVKMDSTYKFAVKYNDDAEVKTIVSAQYWDGTDAMISAADVKAIAAGKTEFAGFKFPATKDGKAVDESKLTLNGVTALSEIKEDDVVTAYAVEGTVVRLDVCNKVVTGKLESRTVDKITVAGTAYKFDGKALKLGEEYNVYFNAAGDVFDVKAVEPTVTEKAYAVVLEANYEKTGDGWSGTTAVETRQVKLLLTTGEEVVYDVYVTSTATPATPALKFADAGAAKTWANDNDNKIVEYTLKDGKLDKCEAPADVVTTVKDSSVSKKAVLDGKYFTSSAVAFVWDSTAKKYTVLTADKLAGLKLDGPQYVVDTTKGQIAVLYTGAAEADVAAVYGIYTGDWSEAKTGVYTLSFYVDGKPVTYNADKNDFDKLVFAKLTFTGETLTTVAAVTGDTAKLTVTTGGTLTGNTYKDATTDYAIDAAAIVYVYDASTKAITVGTVEDLKDEDNTSIQLFDTSSSADKVYDVVFIKR